jgi:hypothetical protein
MLHALMLLALDHFLPVGRKEGAMMLMAGCCGWFGTGREVAFLYKLAVHSVREIDGFR